MHAAVFPARDALEAAVLTHMKIHALRGTSEPQEAFEGMHGMIR